MGRKLKTVNIFISKEFIISNYCKLSGQVITMSKKEKIRLDMFYFGAGIKIKIKFSYLGTK